MSDSLSDTMFQHEDEKLATFRAAEREHILRNKWFLSEKRGCEVSYDFAEFDWFVRFRRKWLDELRESGQYPYDGFN